MSEIVLKSEKREEIGRRLGSLRRLGYIPAILYGAGKNSEPLKVKKDDFRRVYGLTGESTLVSLEVGGKPVKVIIHDVSRDPVSRNFTHVDFYRVRMDKKLRVSVPIVFEGESGAVREQGAVLVKNIHEVEVESLPSDLPHNIKADISRLVNIGDVIHIADLPVPPNVKILKDPKEAVVVAEEPRSESELESLGEEVKVDVSEVKVVGEEERKKKEAEEAELRKTEAKSPEAAESKSSEKKK